MKYSKKIISVLLVVCFTCLSLMGCGSSTDSIDYTETVLTVNGEEVSLGVLNFYARYQQAYTETYYMSYFGDDMWETAMSDTETYEDSVKSTTMTSIEELVIIRQNVGEYDITLTDEEVAEVEAAAAEFIAANDAETLSKVSGTTEVVEEVLTLFLYDYKLYVELANYIDSEVSDEEALQKKMTYVYVGFTTVDDEGETVDCTDEELATIKAELEALIADGEADGDLYTVAEAAGYTPTEITFDLDSTAVDTEVLTAADALGAGEFTGVIETDSAYYIAQLTSEYDEEATETEKLSILSERQGTLYSEVVDAWYTASESVINEEVWSQISFIDLGITYSYDE